MTLLVMYTLLREGDSAVSTLLLSLMMMMNARETDGIDVTLLITMSHITVFPRSFSLVDLIHEYSGGAITRVTYD